MRSKLEPAQIEERLRGLEGWTLRGDGLAIVRTFQFADFSTAWAFMSRVALLAERLDHHPEWSNVYGRVEVGLSTHDVGGVSELDCEVATAINRFAVS